jgi:pimeloyl-ACP methyl ester carboxylesterase
MNGLSQTVWISELMDSLLIEKADAAGVSYGCYIVQQLKMEIPDRIGKIIGMAGSISVEGHKTNTIRMMKVFFPEALFPTDKNAIKLCKKMTGPDSSVLTGNNELFSHWKLLLRNFNNMAISKHESRKKFSKADFLNIKDEALFLIGKYDKFAYYPDSIASLDELGMNYEIIMDAGHVANHEFPGLINKKIIDFLKK